MTMMANETTGSSFKPRFSLLVPGGLPVFVCHGPEFDVYYVPGFASVISKAVSIHVEKALRQMLSAGNESKLYPPVPGGNAARDAASDLLHKARKAVDAASDLIKEPFLPECLTLFLNNTCNLNCRYCHASPGSHADPPISDRTLASAAEMVTASCARKKRPFMLAFHGGGEPSLAAKQVEHILELVKGITGRAGVPLRTYMATNGVMRREMAEWLAHHIDLVGLSCDGPPDIQNVQRPARGGQPTSAEIESTAAELERAARPYHLRATITRDTLDRQPEITTYFMEHFAPNQIRLEPVYVHDSAAAELHGEDAARFVAGFLEARRICAGRGVPVTTSLTRPGAFYGRFCNALRHVLNLVPGDIATGCFLESRESGITQRHARLGGRHPARGDFMLDQEHMEKAKAACLRIPDACRDCLCVYQCTYGCPDICVLQDGEKPETEASLTGLFRCRAHRQLMEELLMDSAQTVWRQAVAGKRPILWTSEETPPFAVLCTDRNETEKG